MQPIDKYNEKGYVVLKGFFDPEEITLLDAQVDPIYRKWLFDNKDEVDDVDVACDFNFLGTY